MDIRFSLRVRLAALLAAALAAPYAEGQQFQGTLGLPRTASGPVALPGYAGPVAFPYATAQPMGIMPYPQPGYPAGLAMPATPPAYQVSVAERVAPVVRPASYGMGGDCDSEDSCQKACGCKGKCSCRSHSVRFFADYLLLRPRDAEYAYAVAVNSNLPPADAVPIQRSRVGVLDPDYSNGFRAGAGFCLDPCSELVATYTMFESSTSDSIERGVNPQLQIDPMAVHPATRDAVIGTAAASGRLGIDYDLIDLDYRRYLTWDQLRSVNYVVGVRWGRLEQDLAVRYADSLASPVSDGEVAAEIDFEGIGLHLGLEGERRFCRVPALIYARGLMSLLAGYADATYQQTVQNNSNFGVDTSWQAGRIVPTFDLELGGGLYGCCGGHLQLTAGYVFSAWTNLVKTEDWVRAVQGNNFDDLGDTMTFDGLVVRAEGRF